MKEKKSVIIFLIITISLSIIIETIWIVGGEAASMSGISALLMWSPAVAAFIVRGIFYRKEKLLGWNKCRWSYILVALFAPVIYLGLSYGIYWLVNNASFSGNLHSLASPASQYSDKYGQTAAVTVITLIIQFIMSNITAMGEEIGWRGFLLPQMAKVWNVKKAIIVSGLIWAVWHMPIMIAGLYMPGTPLWYQLPMFTIEILSFTVIISVLRLKSNSVWPAILLHASHNYVDQVFCMQLTSSANSAYFVGETGFITVIATILVAVGTVKFFGKNVSSKTGMDLSGSTK